MQHNYRWTAAQIAEVASAKSQSELLPLLKNNSALPVWCEYIYKAVVKALQMGNIETAEYLAKLYKHSQAGYTASVKHLEDLEKQFFSWIQLVDLVTRSFGREPYRVQELATELAKHQVIRVVDFVKRPIRTFHCIITSIKDPAQDPEILFEIISSSDPKLDRSDRLNMLALMQRYDRLSLEPYGPEKLSPPFLCMARHRQYLLKYFLGLEGISKCRGPSGENFLAHVAINNPYLKYLKLFTKDELKMMLVEQHAENFVADLLPTFHGAQYTHDYIVALKELLIEGKLKDCKKMLESSLGTFGAKFFHQHGGIVIDNAEYQKAIATYQKSPQKIECIGDSTFCFAELPHEILQIICEELNSRSFYSLFCTSKSLKGLKDRFKGRFYEQMTRKEFPTIYSSLIAQSPTNIDWKQKMSTLARRFDRWQTCHEPKIIKLDASCRYSSIIALDENWLLLEKYSYYNSATFLWNVKSQQLHRKAHQHFTSNFHFSTVLDSPEDDFPVFVSISSTSATVANFQGSDPVVKTVKIPSSNWYVTAISRERFLTGKVPIVYNLEVEQIVAQVDEIPLARHAAHHKLTQMTVIVGENGKIYLTDKNFAVTHEMQTDKSYYGGVTWLDEFTFLLNEYTSHKIGDIRMPAEFVHESSTNKKPIHVVKREGTSMTVPSTGHYTLQVSANHRLACVWNIKSNTWSNVFALPDDLNDRVICNSRYAAFTTKDSGICLLDFDGQKN
jgi:hypothetical protein